MIDLEQHQGEHPRIGAADVVPFVPISGMTMVECVEMARRLGQRVADELEIPVYFYEEAAQRPERRNLEDIRRGEYEGLKQAVLEDSTACRLGRAFGSAGATVIGARGLLPIIYLNTPMTLQRRLPGGCAILEVSLRERRRIGGWIGGLP